MAPLLIQVGCLPGPLGGLGSEAGLGRAKPGLGVRHAARQPTAPCPCPPRRRRRSHPNEQHEVSHAQQHNRRVAADPHHPHNHQPPRAEGAMPLLPQPFAGNLSQADDAITTIMAWLHSRIPYVKGRVPEEPLPPPPPPPAPGSASASTGGAAAAAAVAPPAPTDAAAAGAGAEVQGAAAAAPAELPAATAAPVAAAEAAAAEAAATPAAMPAAEAAGGGAAGAAAAAAAAAAAGPETDLSLIAELQNLEARKKQIIARLAASAGVAPGAAGGALAPVARRIQAGQGAGPGQEGADDYWTGTPGADDYSANADGDPDQV